MRRGIDALPHPIGSIVSLCEWYGCKVTNYNLFCIMKVYEIVKLGSNLLDALQKSCMSMTDCEYLPLYEEYVRLVGDGCL